MKELVSWADFSKIDIRTGTIIQVFDFPEARNPAYQIYIDFGSEIGTKKTSAQITKKYRKEELIGQQIIAVVNFPKKQIANFMSDCLILGVLADQGIILVQPHVEVLNGLKIS
jgi:tRNA-binding protein